MPESASRPQRPRLRSGIQVTTHHAVIMASTTGAQAHVNQRSEFVIGSGARASQVRFRSSEVCHFDLRMTVTRVSLCTIIVTARLGQWGSWILFLSIQVCASREPSGHVSEAGLALGSIGVAGSRDPWLVTSIGWSRDRCSDFRFKLPKARRASDPSLPSRVALDPSHTTEPRPSC